VEKFNPWDFLCDLNTMLRRCVSTKIIAGENSQITRVKRVVYKEMWATERLHLTDVTLILPLAWRKFTCTSLIILTFFTGSFNAGGK